MRGCGPDEVDRGRRVAAGWLLLQGAAVVLWWALVGASTTVRAAFRPAADPTVLDAYLLPDLVLLAGGSVLGGWLLVRGSTWARVVVGAVAGATAYATLHLSAWSLHTGDGWLGVGLMSVALLATLGALRLAGTGSAA